MNAASVHFAPGARTAWHTHPNGQTVYVTEGVGLAQCRDLAMLDIDEQGNTADWGDHVADDEYAAAPPIGAE